MMGMGIWDEFEILSKFYKVDCENYIVGMRDIVVG